MKLEEALRVPKGVFRVFSLDNKSDFEILGDYSLLDIAVDMAIQQQASEDKRKTGKGINVIGNGAVLYPNCSLYGV